MKAIIFLFITLNMYSDTFNIINTNKKVNIEILEPYRRKLESNIYNITQTDWLNEKSIYQAYYIDNAVMFFYICFDNNNYVLMFYSDDHEYLVRNDIDLNVIDREAYKIISFVENNINVRIMIYKDKK